MSTLISGIAASSGIAIAKAYRLIEPELSVEKRSIEDVEAEFQTLDYNQEKLQRMLGEFSQKYNNQISLAAAKLQDKSPLVILSRGYAAAKTSEGKIVKNISQVSEGAKMSVRVSDGVINTNVETTQKLDGDSI